MSSSRSRNNKNQDKEAMPSKKALPTEDNNKTDELSKSDDDHDVLTKRKVADDADDLKPRNLRKMLDGESLVRIP